MSETPRPVLGPDVFVAPTAYVGGDVTIGESSSIMHQVVIRGDIAPIRIGARVNIQDGAVIHTPRGVALEIEDNVGVGHRAVVHGRSVGRRSVIGIGAIVLDHARIGTRCLIAAGTVVTPGMDIPDGSVVMGVPGRIVREVTDRDIELIDHVIESYVELGRRHRAGEFPNIAGS